MVLYLKSLIIKHLMLFILKSLYANAVSGLGAAAVLGRASSKA